MAIINFSLDISGSAVEAENALIKTGLHDCLKSIGVTPNGDADFNFSCTDMPQAESVVNLLYGPESSERESNMLYITGE